MKEVLNQLRRLDEITLMELLEITSDDLVDAFLDKIEENKTRIYKFVNDESEEL